MSFSSLCIRPPYSRTLRTYFEAVCVPRFNFTMTLIFFPKVFPAAIRSGSRAIFSFECPASWLTRISLDLYNEFTSHISYISIVESFRITRHTPEELLSQYRDFVSQEFQLYFGLSTYRLMGSSYLPVSDTTPCSPWIVRKIGCALPT